MGWLIAFFFAVLGWMTGFGWFMIPIVLIAAFYDVGWGRDRSERERAEREMLRATLDPGEKRIIDYEKINAEAAAKWEARFTAEMEKREKKFYAKLERDKAREAKKRARRAKAMRKAIGKLI